MKKLFQLLTIVMMMVCSVSVASAKDKKGNEVAVFTVAPKMHCQNCENKIKSNLRFEKGVSNVTTNLKEQVVTVTYNPAKTDKEKITKAFKKIGYTATEGKSSN